MSKKLITKCLNIILCKYASVMNWNTGEGFHNISKIKHTYCKPSFHGGFETHCFTQFFYCLHILAEEIAIRETKHIWVKFKANVASQNYLNLVKLRDAVLQP